MRCEQCHGEFVLDMELAAWIQELGLTIRGVRYPVPLPRLCNECRNRRRLAFRNERNLYKRVCDATKKEIVSSYSPDKPFPVYERTEWHSDRWSPLDYGMTYDFSRPFFDQFSKLLRQVPQFSIYHMGITENSDYCNACLDCKDCYLSFSITHSENCLYSSLIDSCRDIADCTTVIESELVYEGLDCARLYGCAYISNSTDCRNCYFCDSCKDCTSCFGCVNMERAEYCWFNEQLTKEEYEKRIAEVLPLTRKGVQELTAKFQKHQKMFPLAANRQIQCENSTGHNLIQCQDTKNSFDSHDMEQTWNMIRSLKLKGASDCYAVSGHEFTYEVMSGRGHNHCFSVSSYDNTDSYYCYTCSGCTNVFGCVGLKRKEYCILNRQYTKEEYEELLPRIIQHTQDTKEWGEFFPIRVSPYGYNETLAQEFYPIQEQDAYAQGWGWFHEPDGHNVYAPNNVTIFAASSLPDHLQEDVSWLQRIILSETSQKPYRLIPQEIGIYAKLGIPLPHTTPDERHGARMRRRPPRRLVERSCTNKVRRDTGTACTNIFLTPYAEGTERPVFCNDCIHG